MLTQGRKVTLATLAVIAGVVTAMACGGGGGSYGMSPSPMPTPTPSPSAAADVTITINSMSGDKSFSPNPATVKVAQKVAWHNADSIAHTATGSGFDTGLIQGGATSAPITFAAAGNLDYHCNVHPSMVGALSVTP